MPNKAEYLRISLINECNFSCFYCRPPQLKKQSEVVQTKPEKFKTAISFLHGLGIRKIRFTGGKPTLYRGLTDLISYAKSLDASFHTAVTTNGRLLSHLAPDLGKAGLDSINISLDTLDAARFHQITASDSLNHVLKGIEKAVVTVPKVKLNCVVLKGVNDDEIGSMVEFANRMGVDIRFIEYMPTRNSHGQTRGYLAGAEILSRISYPLSPLNSDPHSAARYYISGRLSIRVGLIAPVSSPFCLECNRIRLTANGNLYGCLFSGECINLFEMLDRSPENVSSQLERLISLRTNTGCSYLPKGDKYLPSFMVTGG